MWCVRGSSLVDDVCFATAVVYEQAREWQEKSRLLALDDARTRVEERRYAPPSL
jgi:hypothetical protein